MLALLLVLAAHAGDDPTAIRAMLARARDALEQLQDATYTLDRRE